MGSKKIIQLLLFLVASGAISSAQTFQTGYFLENNTFTYQFNPASRPDHLKGFIGLGISNILLSTNSDVGLDSFFFPVTIDGEPKLVTGLNENVDAEKFLSGIIGTSSATVCMSENLLSFGFFNKNKKAFFNFEINAKGNAFAKIPKDVFSLLKLGAEEPRTYSANGLSIKTMDYLELASGYSYKINENVSIGGRFKILAGLADASVYFSKVQATADEEIYLDAEGTIDIRALGMTLPITDNGYINFNSGEKAGFGLAGYGAAFDFGIEASFPLVKGLSMNASISDLGGILWTDGNEGTAAISGSIGKDITEIDPSTLFKSTRTGTNKFKGLSASLNLGLKYKVLRMLTIGVAATDKIGEFKNYEARLGVSFNPGKTLSLAATAGMNTFGPCFGAAVSMYIPGINLYLGTDSIITEFTPEYIPVRQLNTRVNMGLAIAF